MVQGLCYNKVQCKAVNEGAYVEEKKVSGRTIWMTVLAVVLGAFASGISAFVLGVSGAMYAWLIFLVPLLSLLLYGAGGILPVCAFNAVALGGSFYLMGGLFAALVLVGACLPAAFMVYESRKAVPFFRQLTHALAAQALGLVAVVVILGLRYGPNLAEVASNAIRSFFDSMGATFADRIAESIRSLYRAQNQIITIENDELIAIILEGLELSIQVGVPMLIVLLTNVNAGLGVLWGNALRARRGEDNVQYKPLSTWYTPPALTLTLTGSIILFTILKSSGQTSIEIVLVTLLTEGMVLAVMQTTASLLRRMKATGASVARRTIMTVALLMLFNLMVIIYGIASAYFGNHGVVTTALKKKLAKNGQGKDKGDFE